MTVKHVMGKMKRSPVLDMRVLEIKLKHMYTSEQFLNAVSNFYPSLLPNTFNLGKDFINTRNSIWTVFCVVFLLNLIIQKTSHSSIVIITFVQETYTTLIPARYQASLKSQKSLQ